MPKTKKHLLNQQPSLYNSQYTTTGNEGGTTPIGGNGLVHKQSNDPR